MKRIILLLLFLFFAFAATLALVRSRSSRDPASPASIVFFTATPQEIGRGEPVTLEWETQGVATVAISWSAEYGPRTTQKREGLPPVGSMTLDPQENTVYVLECETKPGPVCSRSVSVRVRP